MSDRVFLEEYWHFWNLGHTVGEIADIFGMKRSSLEGRAERMGLPWHRGMERRTAELVDEAVERGGPVMIELLPECIDVGAARGRINHHVRAGRLKKEPKLGKSFKRKHPPTVWSVVQ